MIFSKPTKYGAGVEIYGDYQDLNSLRRTILDMSDSPALSDGADEFVLGLAYEVRHAYEGARETSTVSLPGVPPTSYFHFKTLWPIFLMQVALLRWSAAYQATNKEHQCVAILRNSCSNNRYSSFQGLQRGYLFQFISERGVSAGRSRQSKAMAEV